MESVFVGRLVNVGVMLDSTEQPRSFRPVQSPAAKKPLANTTSPAEKEEAGNSTRQWSTVNPRQLTGRKPISAISPSPWTEEMLYFATRFAFGR